MWKPRSCRALRQMDSLTCSWGHIPCLAQLAHIYSILGTRGKMEFQKGKTVEMSHQISGLSQSRDFFHCQTQLWLHRCYSGKTSPQCKGHFSETSAQWKHHFDTKVTSAQTLPQSKCYLSKNVTSVQKLFQCKHHLHAKVTSVQTLPQCNITSEQMLPQYKSYLSTKATAVQTHLSINITPVEKSLQCKYQVSAKVTSVQILPQCNITLEQMLSQYKSHLVQTSLHYKHYLKKKKKLPQ